MTIDFKGLKEVLYSAVLSDVLDALGYPHQAMLPFVRPITDDAVLFGPARTGLYISVFEVLPDENPYEVEIELVDDLKPGEIAIFACNGPTVRLAPWGELMTTAAMQRRAGGFITDGLVRDVRAIRELKFPVFHGGIGPLDSRGRGKMVERDVRVECGGAPIRSGDLVFGDIDGVVVIPGAVAEQAVELALHKINGENTTRDEIRKGVLLGDVYKKYGVL
jgi:regulator of RNase E activity RraA